MSSPGLVLPSPSLFDALDSTARAAMAAELEWFSLPGGQTLFEQGDAADALFLVCSGGLGVVIGSGAKAQVVAEIKVGETIGEMALLTDHSRSATVIAFRDTTLVRVSREAFERLMTAHPRAMLLLTAQIVDRLARTTQQPRAVLAPRIVALIPLGPDVAIERVARDLLAALSEAGETPGLLTDRDAEQDSEAFYKVEASHSLTLYQGALDHPAWTRLCLRRAARILYVATPQTEPVQPIPGLEREPPPWRTTELLLLHPDAAGLPAAVGPALGEFKASVRHQVRIGRRSDMGRLARSLTGRAVGLVLSGGGARGYIHVGVIKALRELGVPLDLIGGTSFGAIIGAGVACEWDEREMDARIRKAFVESSPLDDYTAPVVALTRGRKVNQRLQQHFGEARMEDLWRPFYAVAANISTGQLAVQREGVVWRAVRASVAIPGLLPPMVIGDDVLVDGGVMNNLPTDIMRAATPGPVIAVDIVADQDESPVHASARRPWTRRLFSEAEYDRVGILGVLLRSATVSSEAQAKLCREACDLLLAPPLAKVGLLDWRAFDVAVEAGYSFTMAQADRIAALIA